MKYLFGSQNFGLNVAGSDSDYMQFVFPSASELCNSTMVSKEMKQADGSLLKVKDVRLLPDLFYKSNLDVMQLLFSVEKEPSELDSFLQSNADALVMMNLPKLYSSAMGTTKQRMKANTAKDYAHCLFTLEFLLALANANFAQGTAQTFFAQAQASRRYGQLRESQSLETLASMVVTLEAQAQELKETYHAQNVNENLYNNFKTFVGKMVAKNLV